jgi:hypothetical protein
VIADHDRHLQKHEDVEYRVGVILERDRCYHILHEGVGASRDE